MFEAKLSEGVVFKKIVDSIKDIVTDVNIDVGPTGNYSSLELINLYRYLLTSYGFISCCSCFPQSFC